MLGQRAGRTPPSVRPRPASRGSRTVGPGRLLLPPERRARARCCEALGFDVSRRHGHVWTLPRAPRRRRAQPPGARRRPGCRPTTTPAVAGGPTSAWARASATRCRWSTGTFDDGGFAYAIAEARDRTAGPSRNDPGGTFRGHRGDARGRSARTTIAAAHARAVDAAGRALHPGPGRAAPPGHRTTTRCAAACSAGSTADAQDRARRDVVRRLAGARWSTACGCRSTTSPTTTCGRCGRASAGAHEAWDAAGRP